MYETPSRAESYMSTFAPVSRRGLPATSTQSCSMDLGDTEAPHVITRWKCRPHPGRPTPENLFSEEQRYDTSHRIVFSTSLTNFLNRFNANPSDTFIGKVNVQIKSHLNSLNHEARSSRY